MEEKIYAYQLSSLWLLLELSEVFPNPSRNIILKRRFFRAIALTEPEPEPKIKNRCKSTGKQKNVKYIIQTAEQKKNAIALHSQLNSYDLVASTFVVFTPFVCVTMVWNRRIKSFELAFY